MNATLWNELQRIRKELKEIRAVIEEMKNPEDNLRLPPGRRACQVGSIEINGDMKAGGLD